MDRSETNRTQAEEQDRDGESKRSLGPIECHHFDPKCECNSRCVCHEPWEDFKARVLKLCSQMWQGYTFEVEPAVNGDYHRAAKIKLFFDNQIREYIVRALVERSGEVDTLQRVENLKFAALHSLGAPRIESFKHGYFNNAMDMPYVLQEFVKGQGLDEVLPGLNLKQELSLATAWGSLCKGWLATAATAHAPGRLDPSCPQDRLGKPRIVEYQSPSFWKDDYPDREIVKCRPVEQGISTRDWLWSQYRRLFDVREDLLDIEWESNELYDGALRASEQMERVGMFEDDYYVFDHGCLTTRKIFVDVKDDDVTITGILGWDQAGFVPHWHICKPHHWLWDTEDSDDEDESDNEDGEDESDNEDDEDEFDDEDDETDGESDESDDSDPYLDNRSWNLSRWRKLTRNERQHEDAKERAISEAFNTAAGKDFSSYARQTAYRHARTLAFFAIFGCFWSEHKCLAAHLEHWQELVFPWSKGSYRARRGSVASSISIPSALKDSNASRNAYENTIWRQIMAARARRWAALFPNHRRLLHARQEPGHVFCETMLILSYTHAPRARWISEDASDVEGSDSEGEEVAGSRDIDSDSDCIVNLDLDSDSDSD